MTMRYLTFDPKRVQKFKETVSLRITFWNLQKRFKNIFFLCYLNFKKSDVFKNVFFNVFSPIQKNVKEVTIRCQKLS